MERVSIILVPEAGSVAHDADCAAMLHIILDNIRATGWKLSGSWVQGFAPNPSLTEVLNSDGMLIYATSDHDARVTFVEPAEYGQVLLMLGILSAVKQDALSEWIS